MIKVLKNQRGLTLVELMVAMVIMLIVLAGTIMVFTEQNSLIKDENDTSKVRAKGRLAIKLLAHEVRMAGYGLPPTEGITDMSTANSISFDVNLDNFRAFVDSGSNVSTGATSVTVTDAAAAAQFSSGDEIVIYNPNSGLFDTGLTVSSVSGTTINFSPALANDYLFGAFAKTMIVNKYQGYTIQLANYTANGTTQYKIEKIYEGTTHTLINDIAPAGLTFDYLDFAGATTTSTSAVQRVAITLNMLDPRNPDAVMEFKTDVQIRNSDL